MFQKIFLSLLLLACTYTYMLKSIKDNNDTNFQKMPDSLNFQLNKIKTVKPNIKAPNMWVFKMFLESVFGQKFASKASTCMNDFSDWEKVFTEDVLSKLKECKNIEEQIKIFDDDMTSKLKKDFDVKEQKEIKDEFFKNQENYKKIE